MKYRFLGDSGLLVSALGLGTWITFEGRDAASEDRAYALMAHAFRAAGVNFFDCAECYGADGAAERTLGGAVRRGVADGVWTREDLVLTTKIFMGTKDGPNRHGLVRKHVVEGVTASLARLELDYVDVVYCHRADPRTPIEETVRAMNYVIDQGWAFYWGTSEWPSHAILEACEIADRLGLIRPIAEQPQYNLFERARVELDLQHVYATCKTALTTFSPLAYSVLTGKYAQGVPEDARLAQEKYTTFVPAMALRIQQAERLRPIAEELGCSLAQLAIAWCAANAHVASVIMGASSVAQLDENVRALAFVDKITPEIRRRIDEIVPPPTALPPALDTRYSTMRDKYVM